jgi:hypothetical protein
VESVELSNSLYIPSVLDEKFSTKLPHFPQES